METKASFTFWASWRVLGFYHQLLVKVVRVGIVAHVSQASPRAQVPSAILGLSRRPFGLATARRAPVSCPAALLGLQQTHAHDLRTMHRPHTVPTVPQSRVHTSASLCSVQFYKVNVKEINSLCVVMLD